MGQSKLTVPAEPHPNSLKPHAVNTEDSVLVECLENDTSKLKSTENRTSPSVSTVSYERHCLVISYFRTTIQLGA